MKNNWQNLRFFSIAVFIFALFLIIPKVAFCQTFPPKPTAKLVSDFAKIYSAQENDSLEQKLVTYEKETSTQIAIVTLTTLDGYPIDDYAVKLANQWEIGQKDKNNGLLMLIVVADHKIYIASGYGMEGALNDGKLGSIIRNQIAPHFKTNNYFAGTKAGLDAIIAAAAGEYVNDGKGTEKKDAEFFAKVFMFVALFFVIIILFGRGSAGTSIPIFYSGGRAGGSKGGGFGGFGGGKFGGGGAGGSW